MFSHRNLLKPSKNGKNMHLPHMPYTYGIYTYVAADLIVMRRTQIQEDGYVFAHVAPINAE